MKEERGRRSPGADRPLKGTVEEVLRCHNCLRPLGKPLKAFRVLSGEHILCLQCIASESNYVGEVFCRGCWGAPPPPAPDSGPHHPPQPDPYATIARASQLLRADLQQLLARQRASLLRALDATATLQRHLEAELAAPPPVPSRPPAAHPLHVLADFKRLHASHTSAAIRCRLDDLVGASHSLLDFDLMRRALLGDYRPEPTPAPANPMLFLANFCAAQDYMRTRLQRTEEGVAGSAPLLRMPPSYPLFYFDIEMEGLPCGRFVVEVRDDLAPYMARNFALLCTGELGVGYRGCTVFQCWEGESVITGDFELNNGRGGRAVFEPGFFEPEETRLAAVRGAVGMRRSQRRRRRCGRVGSQFRVVLRDMQGFSAIFGYVVEGLELIEHISSTGDSLGQPHSTILISNCGKLT